MGTDPMTVAQHLRDRLSGGSDDRLDGDLLGVFAVTRDEAAFAALLARHGPMVLGVCRRLLGHVAAAEGAVGVRLALRDGRPGGDEGPDPRGSSAGPGTKGGTDAPDRPARRGGLGRP